MDKDKQRIKIAEACGWDLNHDSQKWDYFQPNGKGWNGPLPDYLNDLNAMHEAEKVLTRRQESDYDTFLEGIVSGYMWQATSEQRAEAFLDTLGLWEDK